MAPPWLLTKLHNSLLHITSDFAGQPFQGLQQAAGVLRRRGALDVRSVWLGLTWPTTWQGTSRSW
eukprot:5761288-Prorocentrum_lima.AAC.1